MKIHLSCLLFSSIFFLSACGNQENIDPLANANGFITIEPITYQLDDGAGLAAQTTDEARLWFSFIPALSQAQERPLFVFFNGGPGSATSSYLLPFNTTPRTLDPQVTGEQQEVAPSLADWSSLGNLLYIDARNSGFSYSLGEAAAGFTSRNFNPYLDAADFVRVLLRFLASHPKIKTNPVILVGESYGAARATLILNLLLNYRRYAGENKIFRDPALVEEIQTHLNSLYPEYSQSPMTAAQIANQFGRQILIAPFIFGARQDQIIGQMLETEGSPIYSVAQATGKTFITCKNQNNADCAPYPNALKFVDEAGRDIYMYNQNKTDWQTRTFTATSRLLKIQNYMELLGSDPRNVAEFKATTRTKAYHYNQTATTTGSAYSYSSPRFRTMMQLADGISVDLQSEWLDTFGQLRSGDAYHVQNNQSVLDVFEKSTTPHAMTTPEIGRLFLENLLQIKTLVTAAAYDLVTYPPAFAESIKQYSEVENITADNSQLTIALKNGAFFNASPAKTCTVTVASFAASGHSVTMYEPALLLEKVNNWIVSGSN